MSMTTFLEYAEAFEQAYATNDWSRLQRYFAEDAVYEIRVDADPPALFHGRDAVLAYFAWVTEHFDKRFAYRRLVPLDPPREIDGSVWLHGVGIYTMPDGARCHLVMEEEAVFAGERISRLVDYITPGGAAEVRAFRRRYPDTFPDEPIRRQA
jgi:ketosteroid isomerase-like protein